MVSVDVDPLNNENDIEEWDFVPSFVSISNKIPKSNRVNPYQFMKINFFIVSYSMSHSPCVLFVHWSTPIPFSCFHLTNPQLPVFIIIRNPSEINYIRKLHLNKKKLTDQTVLFVTFLSPGSFPRESYHQPVLVEPSLTIETEEPPPLSALQQPNINWWY